MTFYTEFAAHYEAIFPFSEGVYAFLRQHFPAPPAQVLDVGCGTGHYTGRLAADGYAALGIDLDPAMIAHARTHYPDAAFEVRNMTGIAALDGPFDAIACIGNTAAHLTRPEFTAFVADVGDLLRPGGVWILQVMNWDYVLTQETVTLPVIEGDGGVTFYRAYRDITPDRVTFATRLEVDGAVIFEDAVPLTPIPAAERLALHAAHGFDLVTHVGSYAGAPFDPTTFSADITVYQRTRD
jgi:SAM-dependent methyltransferase